MKVQGYMQVAKHSSNSEDDITEGIPLFSFSEETTSGPQSQSRYSGLDSGPDSDSASNSASNSNKSLDITTNNTRPSSLSTSSTPIWLILSHFLSTWNSRVFEFSATLFIAVVFPGTLLPASLYALSRSAAAICFSPAVGRFLDSSDRLRSVRVSIVGQRLATAISCLIFLLLVSGSIYPWLRIILLVVLAALACVEKLCSIMNLIAVEKDWVIVISGNDTTVLQRLNSQMRRIDLFCKLVGPLAISVVDSVSTRTAIYVVLITNAVSVSIEYLTISKVYNAVPALEERATPSPSLPPTPSSIKQSRPTLQILKDYIHHPAFLPSLALSTLYLTVLSFGVQMITYLLSTGHSSLAISLIRTISIAFEISATYLAPLAISRVGTIRAGLWFINWQGACVVVAVCSLWIPSLAGGRLATLALVGGVIASRVGLWGIDLCVQLIVQEEVHASHRASFSSTEAALQNFFELLSYLTTAVFPRPAQFRIPALISAIAVLVASALYAEFVRRRRGHLVHVACRCCSKS